MALNRGSYASGSRTRARLIDAASELLAEEGHQAISARRVAARAEVKPQLVHYYFQSMEDLVVTVFQRSCANYGRLHAMALSAENPLRALWELNSHLPEARRMFEYVALGRQFPVLREEMRKHGEQFRKLQIDAIARAYSNGGVEEPDFSAEALAMLMSAVARSIVIEGQVGLSSAHAEIRDLLENWINRFDPIDADTGEPLLPRRTAGA